MTSSLLLNSMVFNNVSLLRRIYYQLMLICLTIINSNVKVELSSTMFSETEFEFAVGKLSLCHQHGLLRSKENADLNKYQHLRCTGVDV